MGFERGRGEKTSWGMKKKKKEFECGGKPWPLLGQNPAREKRRGRRIGDQLSKIRGKKKFKPLERGEQRSSLYGGQNLARGGKKGGGGEAQ